MSRSITGAVHSLYEGTQRVMRGDFSHLIQVKGRDQLAELSTSFNTMTQNLERLLAVAKEKERMQAEIEIARGVQDQLYPKAPPVFEEPAGAGIVQSGAHGVGRLLRLPVGGREARHRDRRRGGQGNFGRAADGHHSSRAAHGAAGLGGSWRAVHERARASPRPAWFPS